MRLPAWHVHPDVWLLFGSIVAVYLIAARRHLEVTGEETPRRKKVLFLTGMGVLWLGADWPVHDLAEGYLYLMHMTQHLLFTLVAAPLLIAGMPVWLLRAVLAPPPIRRAFHFVTRALPRRADSSSRNRSPSHQMHQPVSRGAGPISLPRASRRPPGPPHAS